MIFSCEIAELFTEGTSLFDLSKLLAYRRGEYDPTPTLDKIEAVKVRVRKELLDKEAKLKLPFWFTIIL